jgi:hypothetical protein
MTTVIRLCVSNLCSLHCFNGYVINSSLFNRAVSSLDYIVLNGQMIENNELENMEGWGKWPKLRVLSQYLPAGNEGDHRNTSIRMINVLVKIQTGHLQKISKYYRLNQFIGFQSPPPQNCFTIVYSQHSSAEYCSKVISTYTLYLQGPRLESRLIHQLLVWCSSWFHLVPPAKCLDSSLKWL